MGAVITAFPSENLVFGTYKNGNKPNSLYGNTAEWNITKDFCLYLIKNGPIRNPFPFKILYTCSSCVCVCMHMWVFQDSVWNFCFNMHINLYMYVFVYLVAKSCLTLCDPMDCTLQASLSFTISWSLLKFIFTELVMPSNCLILCCPLLLLPSILPSIRTFSNE